LAFAWDEHVVASRDNCRLLLVRLKMDGWALGKTKVFLKYYHVEYLSKLYEDQVSIYSRKLNRILFNGEKYVLHVKQSISNYALVIISYCMCLTNSPTWFMRRI
jgi:hypothetical protein